LTIDAGLAQTVSSRFPVVITVGGKGAACDTVGKPAGKTSSGEICRRVSRRTGSG